MLRPPEEPDVQRDSLAAIVRRRLSWLVVLAVTFVAAPTLADPGTEKAAQALQKKAIEEDSLNVNYPAAVKKLQSATKKCSPDKCSPQVRASLFRDLGAMQILNGAADEGKANFAQAISLDASIELDPAYKTAQLEGVWTDVKKNGGGAGASAAPVKAGPQPTEGDFTVTPPPEAPVRTPLPIYVEYGGSEDLTRVAIKYKGATMSDWKSLDLPKVDQGYGALIPCKDVTPGLMLYFVQGFNDKNDPVATSGSKKQPFSVPVNAQLIGPPPTLPGQDPPAQCEDVAGSGTECPPDFPGCGKKKAADEDCSKDEECESGSCSDGKCGAKKQNGEECTKDAECSSDQCASGKCSGGKKAEGEDCEADEDCDSGRCKEEKCAAGASSGRKGPKLWIGVSVSLDATIVPGANDVCSRTLHHVNTAGYSCTDPGSSTPFPDPNANSQDITNYQNLVLGDGDQVVGGFKFPSTIRVVATLDYALGKNSMLGFRAGYVFGTDPAKSAFAPVHLETRFTYLFGKDAVNRVGLAPMMLVGVGAGEFDAFVPVTANLKCVVGCSAPGVGVGKTESGPVDAWLTSGPVFVTAGFGARYLITSKIAALAALKFQGAFGGSAGFLPGFAPELGFQYGF
jgi:hypothetical protein